MSIWFYNCLRARGGLGRGGLICRPFVLMLNLIVGLGNPGRKYQKTRHNLGFRVVDHLAAERGRRFKSGKGDYLLCEIREEERTIRLLKPLTYMNASGEAVAEALERLGHDVQDLLVVCDDANLPLGKIRIREKGSDGGHKGLRSIIYHLGSVDFARLRMGVGQAPEGIDLEEFVLAKFDGNEKQQVGLMIETACQAAESVWISGLAESMSRFNG
jgi:PTH1 family peptidyl-tRNA hydrolase